MEEKSPVREGRKVCNTEPVPGEEPAQGCKIKCVC